MLKFNSFPKHHARGKKAQAIGAMWEGLFQAQAKKNGVLCIRIENGCRSAYMKLIRVLQPFDFILSYNGKALFVDTKITKSVNYTFSMITQHQIKHLHDLEVAGHLSGYIVNFTKHNKIVFFKASDLKKLQEKQSLGPQDGEIIGSEMTFDLKLLFT